MVFKKKNYYMTVQMKNWFVICQAQFFPIWTSHPANNIMFTNGLFIYHHREIQVLISRVRKAPQGKRGLKEQKESQEALLQSDNLIQLLYL